MKLVAFLVICEGEFELACEALHSLLWSCANFDVRVMLLDDGSPSKVGQQLKARFASDVRVDCLELPRSLGFRGSAIRAFSGLNWIASQAPDTDLVVKIDADALVLRSDLGAFMAKTCPDQMGLCGELHTLRRRDALLYLADQLPLGFRRAMAGPVIQHRWELKRWRPVWWADLGRAALVNGFRFKYAPGCFWYLGGKTLRALAEGGYLARPQDVQGLVFNDDVLLTTAVHVLGHPVIDTARSQGWGDTMGMSEKAPLDLILRERPYVVHPLKNNADAWQRRKDLAARGLGPPIEQNLTSPRRL
jgi:hypothetical protein